MRLEKSGGVTPKLKRGWLFLQEEVCRLGLAFSLLMGLGVFELVISHWHQNLSLFADAGHVIADAGAVALTLFTIWLRPSQQERLNRIEVAVALVNGLSLFAISSNVIMAAIARFQAPTLTESYNDTVLLTAIASFAVNGFNIFWLEACSCHRLSLRSAFLHILADFIGAIGVIVGFMIGRFLGLVYADAIVSLVTSIIIIFISFPLVLQSLLALTQPAGADDTQTCLCQSDRQALEKILFPSLEQLV